MKLDKENVEELLQRIAVYRGLQQKYWQKLYQLTCEKYEVPKLQSAKDCLAQIENFEVHIEECISLLEQNRRR